MRHHRHAAIGVIATIAIVAAACLMVPAAQAMALYEGSYVTDISASVPVELEPASGTSLVYPSTPLQLSWRAVAGASTYQVQVAHQPSDATSCDGAGAFSEDAIVVTSTVRGTTWVPTMVDDENGSEVWTGRYCWRVRVEGKVPGAWSAAKLFTRTWASTVSGLRFYNDVDGPIPRTASNADHATGSTSTRVGGYLSWNRVSGAATYELQISTSQSFSPAAVLVTRTGISDSRVNLLHLPDDTYYWRVRAIALNGTEGEWSSGANAFTVRWVDPAWSTVRPVDSAAASELRIGWTPVPGATYYEYQIGTAPGCMWNPDYPALAPPAYGDWVNYEAVHVDPGGLQSTADPQPAQCRLSDVRAVTINNWVTLEHALGTDAWKNILKPCIDVKGKVLCEPAGLPDSTPDDWGAAYHGAAETPGGSNDGRYGNAYEIFWRVRPVFELTQESQTDWLVSGTHRIYGSWNQFTSGGATRAYKFSIDPAAATPSSVGTRCDGGCLEMTGSAMQAADVPGNISSSSMQFPLLTWKPFAGASGYLVELARDPDFNNIVDLVEIGAGWQQSYAWTKSFGDNSEGTGYWWRVTPCQRYSPAPGSPLTECLPMYTASSGGLPLAYAVGTGYSDTGVARTFTKQTALQTRVVANFEGNSPLLQWASASVASSDYAGWSRGIVGARHYDVEFSRSPFMTDPISVTTTIARIIPMQPSGTPGKSSPIGDGLWYFRVRAVDRDGLVGPWSSVSSFSKRIDATESVSVIPGNLSKTGATATWSEVVGASSYTFQYDDAPSFSSPKSMTVNQAAARIPGTEPGSYFWRVRANLGTIEGPWTSRQGPVQVAASSTIAYALNRSLLAANSYVTIHGQLKVAGTPSNEKFVQLQKKTTGCESATGTYVTLAQKLTGTITEDGMVTFRAPVRTNGCYRLAWLSEFSFIYSTPIAVKARPEITFRLSDSTVARGKRFCGTLRSSVPITGRLNLQYRVGGSWRTAKAVNIVRKTRHVQCAGIYRSGSFQVRALVDRQMSADWKRLEDVTARAGTLSVNDAWRVIR